MVQSVANDIMTHLFRHNRKHVKYENSNSTSPIKRKIKFKKRREVLGNNAISKLVATISCAKHHKANEGEGSAAKSKRIKGRAFKTNVPSKYLLNNSFGALANQSVAKETNKQ